MSAHAAVESPASVIAIDGPAGAGKSTAARMLAARLGFVLLDTGALYRALALVAVESKVDWHDAARLEAMAERMDIRFTAGVAEPGEARPQVWLGARDITEAIRMPVISDGASQVSSHPAVRRALLERQRSLASKGRVVVEGRDIGSVVLPWAPVKFFLTAAPEVRAQRRHAELLARGVSVDLSATLAELKERDRRDETRSAAPLRQAPDALLIDTSLLPIEAVVVQMEQIVRARLGMISA